MNLIPPTIKFPLSRRAAAVAGIVLAVVLLIGLPAVRYAVFLAIPAGNGRNVKILDFREGFALKKIAAELETSRLISSKKLFILYARLRGGEEKIKAGAYLFNDGMTPAVILNKLLAGDVYVRRFAVPEGYSTYQLAALLEQRGIFRKETFLKECSNRALLAELGIEGTSVEGYLYPSTYNITPHTTEADLIREMVRQFRKRFSGELEARASALNMSVTEILTIASMVEKEAVVPRERPLIASVFHNRLSRKMPLQSDPTAVYRVRAFAGKVSKRDILRNSPYNTYKISGLPPGPIGNPGNDAIEAVLNPARTNYLYFVARMDGTHYFSTTLEEHNRAVRAYLKPRPSAAGAQENLSPEFRNNYPVMTGAGGS